MASTVAAKTTSSVLTARAGAQTRGTFTDIVTSAQVFQKQK